MFKKLIAREIIMKNKAKLIFEDGTIFDGYAAGYPKSTAGEVVFTTGMTGYDLSLTDPSYAGQILIFTYPLIGNWGIPPRGFWESDKIQVAGVVISDLTQKPNHWQSDQTLNDWLEKQKIPAIVEVDTRSLTQKIRDRGAMLGKIIIDNKDISFWDPNSENLVAKVSPKQVIIHRPRWEMGDAKPDLEVRRWKKLNPTSHIKNPFSHISHRTSLNIALLNCGSKKSILQNLLDRGATVYELPWNFDPFENELPIDGLVISNGPGNPKMAKASIAIIKKSLIKKLPTFGICLGSQLLALAAGGNTYKLKFGHRAQNQPTIDVKTKRCYITTQNHGFAVDDKKLPSGFIRWFYNANDNTNEGIHHKSLPFFSVQFHPEAAPGPTDAKWLFDYFFEKIINQ